MAVWCGRIPFNLENGVILRFPSGQLDPVSDDSCRGRQSGQPKPAKDFGDVFLLRRGGAGGVGWEQGLAGQASRHSGRIDSCDVCICASESCDDLMARTVSPANGWIRALNYL